MCSPTLIHSSFLLQQPSVNLLVEELRLLRLKSESMQAQLDAKQNAHQNELRRLENDKASLTEANRKIREAMTQVHRLASFCVVAPIDSSVPDAARVAACAGAAARKAARGRFNE